MKNLGQLPFLDGFVINSVVTLRQTIPPFAESDPPRRPRPPSAFDRPIVLVGLMGAGKSRVGRRLAERLGLNFIDTDHEIERETCKTISELFAVIGEPAFRAGERRVVSRLVQGPVAVIAIGGGAYMNEETRKTIRQHAFSIWLRADLETLVARTARSQKRPLLEGTDKAAKLAELMRLRYPVYAEADIVVDSVPGPVENTVVAVLAALGPAQSSGKEAGR
jgi:shikimate kinase